IAGRTLDPLPRGPASRWDRANAFRVQLFGGALASVPDARLLDGANAAALRQPDGRWEVLQFGNAELVGEGTYLLSRLLRGQAGSAGAIGDPLPADAAFVLLDAHLVPIARGLDALGRPMHLRLVAAGRDHGDPSSLALEATPQPTALRPLAPVHLRATRGGSGVTIRWIRRTRIDGDSWAAADVPLGEAFEAYEIDILAGSDVIRTLTANAPQVLYAAADEIADFGSPQATLSVRVVQMSATVGRGLSAEATFSL
ncbi:MAG: hypothetical protein HXY30_20630, partial [Pseudorhodoplanes sp.]|nr:hypothetical protein [Pseudorhodoplanes sp.]